MPRFRTQSELDAYARSVINPAQRETFDKLMATGTWQVNKTSSDLIVTNIWLESKGGTTHSVVAIDVNGKIERPIKGSRGSVTMSRRTGLRVY